MKEKGKEGTPLRMIGPDHHLPFGTGLEEMELLAPKVALGISLEVGWNCMSVPWMDERGEIALQRLARQHSQHIMSLI